MLAVVRLVAVAVFLIFTTIVGVTYCLLRPFHPNNVHIFARWYGWTAKLFGVKVEIRGMPSDNQSRVYVANHQNSYDIFTISGALPVNTVTVGKKSLKYIPFFGWLYWLSGNILIDRANKSRAAGTIADAAAAIKQRGISVWLFPEGTRSNGRGLLPFKTGAFHTAVQAQVPIVPVCMNSIHQQIKLNRWNNGRMIIEFLPAIAVTEADKPHVRELANQVHQQMAAKIAELDAELQADEAKLLTASSN